MLVNSPFIQLLAGELGYVLIKMSDEKMSKEI